MDELDHDEKSARAFDTKPAGPVTLPIAKLEIEPLASARAADGTRSRISAAEHASDDEPEVSAPPPRAARASRPPPIPQDALDRTIRQPERFDFSELVARPRKRTAPPPIPTPRRTATLPPPIPALRSQVPAREPAVVVTPSLGSEAAIPPTAEPSTRPTRDALATLWPDVPVTPEARLRPNADVAAWPIVAPAPVPAPLTSDAVDVELDTGSDAAPIVDVVDAGPTECFDRALAPARWIRPRYIVAGGIGAVALIAIIAIAVASSGSDAPATAAAVPTATTPSTTHATTHAMTSRRSAVRPATKPIAHHATAAATVAAKPAAPATERVATTAPSTNTTAPPAAATADARVEVPIHSWPPGATVMLVSDGVTTKLGQTPVVAKLDPSRAYDLVLAAQDRPTIIRHLPAHTTREVDIDFDAQPKTTRTSPAPSRIATVAKPHANVATHRRTSKHQKIATRRTRHHETARHTRRREVAAATRAKRHASARVDRETGTLALETDPPCEIVIDGKVTHLHTPQRAIRLSHGPHAVKLVNRAKRIQQSFVVHVEAGRSTKLFHRFRTH